MSQELNLIDYLDACDEPFLYIERCVFASNRERALHAIAAMQASGSIKVLFHGNGVEPWRISAWRREPYGNATQADLEQTTLQLTDLPIEPKR